MATTHEEGKMSMLRWVAVALGFIIVAVLICLFVMAGNTQTAFLLVGGAVLASVVVATGLEEETPAQQVVDEGAAEFRAEVLTRLGQIQEDVDKAASETSIRILKKAFDDLSARNGDMKDAIDGFGTNLVDLEVKLGRRADEIKDCFLPVRAELRIIRGDLHGLHPTKFYAPRPERKSNLRKGIRDRFKALPVDIIGTLKAYFERPTRDPADLPSDDLRALARELKSEEIPGLIELLAHRLNTENTKGGA